MMGNTLTMPRALPAGRLVLTAPKDADMADLLALYGDPETARFIGGPFTDAGIRRLAASFCEHWDSAGHGVYVVRDSDGDRDGNGDRAGAFVGVVGLYFPADWPELELTYTLAPHARGAGHGTRAARAVAEAAASAGARSLVSYIDPHNAPSKALARRLGARHTSTIILRGTPSAVFRYPVAAWRTAKAAA